MARTRNSEWNWIGLRSSLSQHDRHNNTAWQQQQQQAAKASIAPLIPHLQYLLQDMCIPYNAVSDMEQSLLNLLHTLPSPIHNDNHNARTHSIRSTSAPSLFVRQTPTAKLAQPRMSHCAVAPAGNPAHQGVEDSSFDDFGTRDLGSAWSTVEVSRVLEPPFLPLIGPQRASHLICISSSTLAVPCMLRSPLCAARRVVNKCPLCFSCTSHQPRHGN